MFSCKACSPADQTTDTVKFDAASIARQQEEAEREEQRRAQEEAEQQRLQEQRRAEEEQRRTQAEQEQRRLAEEEERRRLEEEQARLQREEEDRAAAARAAEEEEAAKNAEQARLEKEAAEDRERRAAVTDYLKKKGFKGGAADPKKSLMSTTYPLHSAAKDGDDRMVVMLLKEGALASQKNSSGKTAMQVAEKSNKGGSHSKVLEALGGSAPAGRVGGC